MQFQYPNILYALLLLLIPLIIHLVRWKKYIKEIFTNVDFLQDLEIKSRKSRKLKELIVLLLRLLAFAMLIVAFARPFFPSKASKSGIKNVRNIIYIDNSRSLSVLNGKTNLWQQYIQDINQNMSAENEYTLLTNDQTFEHINGKNLTKILQETHFSNQPAYHTGLLKKIALLAGGTNKASTHVLYLSDLQKVEDEKLSDSLFLNNVQYHFYPKQVKELANISIDSIWQTQSTAEYYELKLKLSANNPQLHTQVSIKTGHEVLWNNNVNFKDSLQQSFEIQLPKRNIEGKVEITDKGFQFDNRLFFSLQQPDKINVLVIGNQLPEYLKKIYTPDEFVLIHKKSNQLSYNDLYKYHLIIITGYSADFNLSISALNRYLQQYGNLLIIPANNQEKALSQFLQSLQVNVQASRDTARVFLNKINYNHPVFDGIFLKKVKNFAYPFVREHYHFSRQGKWLYKLSDHSAFAQIYGRNANIIVVNSPLNKENTNFTSAASLIVPLLYSLAFNHNKKEQLYYVLGTSHLIDIHTRLDKDEIIKLKLGDKEYIPRQKILGNKVQILTGELPEEAGIYRIIHKQQQAGSIAFNYDRKENRIDFIDIPSLANTHRIESLGSYVEQQQKLFKEKRLWKYFLMLALLFLLLEMLVIKFWK